jgi:hypothetical protein
MKKRTVSSCSDHWNASLLDCVSIAVADENMDCLLGIYSSSLSTADIYIQSSAWLIQTHSKEQNGEIYVSTTSQYTI